MTNTHINVGGHKITTNRVGQVHTATLASGYSGDVKYCVTNGICTVTGNAVVFSTGINQAFATGLPKNKFGVSVGGVPIFTGVSENRLGVCYIGHEGTVIIAHIQIAGTGYFSFSYPVADDWVES